MLLPLFPYPYFPPSGVLYRCLETGVAQIVGKHKDKMLYRGIGGVQEEHKEAYSNRGIFWEGKTFYNVYK